MALWIIWKWNHSGIRQGVTRNNWVSRLFKICSLFKANFCYVVYFATDLLTPPVVKFKTQWLNLQLFLVKPPGGKIYHKRSNRQRNQKQRWPATFSIGNAMFYPYIIFVADAADIVRGAEIFIWSNFVSPNNSCKC